MRVRQDRCADPTGSGKCPTNSAVHTGVHDQSRLWLFLLCTSYDSYGGAFWHHLSEGFLQGLLGRGCGLAAKSRDVQACDSPAPHLHMVGEQVVAFFSFNISFGNHFKLQKSYKNKNSTENTIYILPAFSCC